METIISKIGKDKLIKLYIHLRDELIEFASKSGVSDLEEYFKPDIVRKQNYLEILASSLQNSGQMRNSIKFNDSEFNHNKYKNAYMTSMQKKLRNIMHQVTRFLRN